jgi:glycerol kinase
MTPNRFVLGIDQGTTYTKVVVVDWDGIVLARAHRKIQRHFPRKGWVEQDAAEIWSTVVHCITAALADARVSPSQLEAIGLCAQMGTAVVWNRAELTPVGRAISWQDNRTRDMCESLNSGHLAEVESLIASPFVTNATGPKLRWLFDNDFAVQSGVAQGKAVAGPVSSWLLANLSKGEIFAADYSSAATTQLVDMRTLAYHDELLSLLEIPRGVLPEVRASGDIYGHTTPELLGETVPIAAVLGDIPSSAIGADARAIGDVTLSLGTGAFLLVNTGDLRAGPGLIPVVVDADGSEVVYGALASANVSGAAIEWLKAGVEMINDPTEVDGIASQASDSGGVFFVPSFAGLASPPDPFATGLMIGLGQDTTKANIVRAVLEGMAFQVRDMFEGARSVHQAPILSITATGGASASDVLMQILSDTLGIALERPGMVDSAALGAAVRAGVSVGFWSSLEEAATKHPDKTRFEPRTSADRREFRYGQWKRAVDRARHWDVTDPGFGHS